MPTIEVSREKMLKLLGKKLSDKELEDSINSLKAEVEEPGKTMKIEVTPDRPDMLSASGIARALKGVLGIETGIPEYKIKDSDLQVKIGKTQREFAVCAAVYGADLDDESLMELMQFAEKIDLSIGRDRKKIAIGLHDLDKIKGPIEYCESGAKNARFVPLGEKEEMNIIQILEKHKKGIEYKHLVKGMKKYPVWKDAEGVLSFPPVINSERTKVTAGTKNIFIDLTGTDRKAVEQGLNILLCNMAEAGGTIGRVIAECRTGKEVFPDISPEKMTVDSKYISKLLGLDIQPPEIADCISRSRFGAVLLKDGNIDILVPKFRADILHKADMAEEAAIGYGYSNFAPEIPEICISGFISKENMMHNIVRDLMAGFGFQETMNFVLTDGHTQSAKMGTKIKELVELENPVSSEHSVCRAWILPQLMSMLSKNKNRDYPQKLFELGECVARDKAFDTGAGPIMKLSAVSCHSGANFTEIKGTLESLLQNIGVGYELKAGSHPSFITGRCGIVKSGKKEIGFFGELHPKALNEWNLINPASAFEIEAEF